MVIQCPKCSNMADLPDSAEGKQIRCGQCGTIFPVPRLSFANENLDSAEAEEEENPEVNCRAQAILEARSKDEEWEQKWKTPQAAPFVTLQRLFKRKGTESPYPGQQAAGAQDPVDPKTLKTCPVCGAKWPSDSCRCRQCNWDALENRHISPPSPALPPIPPAGDHDTCGDVLVFHPGPPPIPHEGHQPSPPTSMHQPWMGSRPEPNLLPTANTGQIASRQQHQALAITCGIGVGLVCAYYYPWRMLLAAFAATCLCIAYMFVPAMKNRLILRRPVLYLVAAIAFSLLLGYVAIISIKASRGMKRKELAKKKRLRHEAKEVAKALKKARAKLADDNIDDAISILKDVDRYKQAQDWKNSRRLLNQCKKAASSEFFRHVIIGMSKKQFSKYRVSRKVEKKFFDDADVESAFKGKLAANRSTAIGIWKTEQERLAKRVYEKYWRVTRP